MNERPFVSVIIPVYNDAERLAACLQALHNQTYPAKFYELLVVDNGSSPPLGPLTDFPQARLLLEMQPGSYSARNTGLAQAKGEVIAFTDSDCLPAGDWIERGVAALGTAPGCGLVGGRIDVFPRDPQRPTLVELYEMITAFRQDRLLVRNHAAVTANLFTRRAVLDTVGPFNAELRSGGDMEWGRRVHAAGYELVYGADVAVRHPSRHTLEERRKRDARVASGWYDRDKRAAMSPLRFWLFLLLHMLPHPLHVLRLLGDGRLRGPRQRVGVLLMDLYTRWIQVRAMLRRRRGGGPLRE